MGESISICLVGGEDAHKRIELSKYLINNNFKVTILGTKDYDYPEGITFIKYKLNRGLNPVSDFKTVLEYRKIVRENGFDIVQTFDTKPAFLFPFAMFGIKVNIVRTITGLGKVFVSKDLKSKPLRWLYLFLHFIVRNKVSHTTFQNKDDRDLFMRNKLIKPTTYSMIYGSGIDLNKITTIAPRKADPFSVICVSRLIYEKGITYYMEAAKICAERGHAFKFLLVGPLEENSEKLNEGIIGQYEKYVSWLGTRNDVDALLLASDIFVLPTFYREGFARVLLEASAVGLPLVTTNVPGVTDIARHQKEALIVPPKNASDLAQAIIDLAEDQDLADRLSKNALLNVKQYSMEVISKNYVTLYKAIL
ncbi:glycosyltransferase [Spongiimicrobium sp. 3-5]|uniref:glycosyltransferase n=1 Tax=Spongiimicrobium sp. 3-5 TaxID=3332596 RepID=UPI003980A3B5